MKILFLDAVCPKPYDRHTLDTEGMGGSESTLVRVAEALAKTHEVDVIQHNRVEGSYVGGVNYAGMLNPKYDVVIVQRNFALVPIMRAQYPSAKIILWMHDVMPPSFTYDAQALADAKCTIVCVSSFHRNLVDDLVHRAKLSTSLPRVVINNLVQEPNFGSSLEVDSDKLFFASTPAKGLNHTLRLFQNFASFPKLANLKLYYCNPGYADSLETSIPNVINLGSIPTRAVQYHMATSWVVLSANTTFRETYGNVFAESLQNGTPFLAHDMASGVKDISTDPRLFVNMADNKKVIERLIEWRTYGRPLVEGPSSPNAEIVHSWLTIVSK